MLHTNKDASYDIIFISCGAERPVYFYGVTVAVLTYEFKLNKICLFYALLAFLMPEEKPINQCYTVIISP